MSSVIGLHILAHFCQEEHRALFVLLYVMPCR